MEGAAAREARDWIGCEARQAPVGLVESPREHPQQRHRQLRRALQHLQELALWNHEAVRALDRDDRRRARLVAEHAQLSQDLALAELADDELHRGVGRDLEHPDAAGEDREEAIRRVVLADEHLARREGLLARAGEEQVALLGAQLPKDRHGGQEIRSPGPAVANARRRLAARRDALDRIEDHQRASEPRAYARPEHRRAEGLRQVVGPRGLAAVHGVGRNRAVGEDDDRKVAPAQAVAQHVEHRVAVAVQELAVDDRDVG